MRRGTPGAIEFGKRIREIRTKKGMSQIAVAERLGSFGSHVSQVESAIRAVKEDKIWVWSDALGVSERSLRKSWKECDAMPAPPLKRKHRGSVQIDKLQELIDELSAAERQRVLGYIEAVMDLR